MKAYMNHFDASSAGGPTNGRRVARSFETPRYRRCSGNLTSGHGKRSPKLKKWHAMAIVGTVALGKEHRVAPQLMNRQVTSAMDHQATSRVVAISDGSLASPSDVASLKVYSAMVELHRQCTTVR